MANTRIQPNFKRFAALQNEPAKGSLDPRPKAKQEDAEEAPDDDATGQKGERLTISQYHDPRDQLDQERHLKLARARRKSGA